MERRNSTKRCHDEKHVQDDGFKRQKSISDDLNMQTLVMDDPQPPLPEEEEEEQVDGQQQQLLAIEEKIFPTCRGNDFGAGRFLENIGEKVITLFNNLPGKLPLHIHHQKPTKIKLTESTRSIYNNGIMQWMSFLLHELFLKEEKKEGQQQSLEEEDQEQEQNEEEEEEKDKEGQKADKERQLFMKEEDIISEDCVDFSGCSLTKPIGKIAIVRLFNDLAEKLSRVYGQFKPVQDDGGAPLHMMSSCGTPVSLGMQLRQSNEGFDVCQVNERSLIKDKLRVGDKIIKVCGLEMADMKIEDIQKLFMRNKSIKITIKRSIQLGEDCVDGKNGVHSFVLSCTLAVQDDGVEVFDVNFERCGKYQLMFHRMQSRMCLFRNDFTNGSQAYLRCKNATIEAGKFHQTMSSFEVRTFINLRDTTKQVWILGNESKFITASGDRSNIELTDGQVGPLISCDGRAFIYSKYSPDSFSLESLEHPKHYLGIDGNEVKLLYFNNFPSDDDERKCKLEVKAV
ncbi:uncharacterized protein LOC117117911 [Anneissia japonica]|uniref:uncharacterized protein LOC117117911 n=1 Tax=Anneissia japonica TaxID=1529436 RepID=UPI0014258C74|nr:uncharacterized protein LOC117117911 [Anneissia japonica]